MKDWRWLVSFWLAFLMVLYVWLHLARYEFQPTSDGLYVFDKWTTRIERGRVTPARP